ncbi:hypothetical protein Y032_0163g3495 [Ancylostoma ceylanicum]|uniref:Uncharacterized protein n=1 Tax=Ancylostoma ceylanicum TaxID=53326 RepID=A0A016SXL0_9BILA|nr:hypothetical protein Y032_0163g3495 [Ancylostoma ceylanicum]
MRSNEVKGGSPGTPYQLILVLVRSEALRNLIRKLVPGPVLLRYRKFVSGVSGSSQEAGRYLWSFRMEWPEAHRNTVGMNPGTSQM